MNLFSRKSNELKQVLQQSLICYQIGDIDLCRKQLQDHLNIAKKRTIRKYSPENFDEGNKIFEMLYDLDFDDCPEGSPERTLYLRTFLYLIENAPPEIKEELNQELEKVLSIEPVGYTDNGELCYKLSDVVKIFGISEEKDIRILEKTGGLIENEIQLVH